MAVVVNCYSFEYNINGKGDANVNDVKKHFYNNVVFYLKN